VTALRALAIGLAVAATAAAAWTTHSTPSQAASVASSIQDVACPSGARCLAVGFQSSLTSVQAPLAETWDRRTWTVEATQSPAGAESSLLEGVACTSSTSCVAVGHQDVAPQYFGAAVPVGKPLAEVWDGLTWSIRPVPVPTGAVESELYDVSCTSSMCMAVGHYENRSGAGGPLAEMWDGTAWSLLPTPGSEFAEDSVLRGVACPSATSCVAVGYYEHEVNAIFSATATLVESWDGRTWRVRPSPTPAGSRDAELNAVACPSAGQCMAVGFQRLPSGVYAPLVESWNGEAWRIVPTGSPNQSPDAELEAVSCPEPDRCLAVGYQQLRSGAVVLAESWDGARWAIQPISGPPGAADSTLNGIECAAATSCLAAGSYRQRSLVEVGLAEAWDGTAWTILKTPDLSGHSPAP